MKKSVIAILFVVGLSSSSAFYKTGNDLLAYMQECDLSDNASYSSVHSCGYAMAFVVGVHDANKTIREWDGEIGGICTTDEVTSGQLVAVVRKYLEDNPAKLHASASSLVLNALELAFPCKKIEHFSQQQEPLQRSSGNLSDNPYNELIGTWRGTTDDGSILQYEFRSNNEVTWTLNADSFEAKFRCKCAEDPIEIDIYEFSDDKLKQFVWVAIAQISGNQMAFVGKPTDKDYKESIIESVRPREFTAGAVILERVR